MTDEPTINPADTPAPTGAPEAGAPTPQELLAETTDDDPEVGVDGIGMGELP